MEPGTGALKAAALESWIATQRERSIAAMELAISATHLVRRRDEFDQTIVPSPGSVLASIAIGNWQPEPDYFYHWIRDSAIVMRTVAELMRDAGSASERRRWQTHFENFISFSLALTGLTGTNFDRSSRQHTRPSFRKFLRPGQELREMSGDKLLGEPRFNPDGTLDVMRWSRPQYDGPALRALACLSFFTAGGTQSEALGQLLKIDLDFTSRHAGRRCVGPWEEKAAHHYGVALIQLGALIHGQCWIGDAVQSAKAEKKLRTVLERHWSEKHQIFVSALPAASGTRDDLLDASFLLGVMDADLPHGPHSVEDRRVQKTQAAVEGLFSRVFPINRTLFARRAPALGRYRGDKYFGGGAWYPTTLAGASIYYRRACGRAVDRAGLIAKGDDVMATLRDLTPANGELSEQVDRNTGRQTSARHLTWSHAAFISASGLRERALKALARR